jgi:methylthioribose-1-phosphate isomerase
MRVGDTWYRTIWRTDGRDTVSIIDQTRLPHAFEVIELVTVDDAVRAIRDMQVRGAPLIGATAAWGVWLGMRHDPSDAGLEAAVTVLGAARPTAVNLRWALARVHDLLGPLTAAERADAAAAAASAICDEDVAINRAIGEHGLPLLEEVARDRADGRVRVLTHCNAGWLATVDWGTALSPIYRAHDAGLDVHVWVDETRPRNQGAALTAWELGAHGVPHTVIADNAGGHLMQRGEVDLVLVGTDRTTASGDVANKIGTYLKALAAADCGVPFYVALPTPTIDWGLTDGMAIPIEERDAGEVTRMTGRTDDGQVVAVTLTPDGSAAANPAFDVTPARLVTGFVTDRGVCPAGGLRGLYPDGG